MDEETGTLTRDLQGLLLNPREKLEIEYKGWLNLNESKDKANLAKAIMAIANHCGGYIIIGYTEDEGRWVPEETHPTDLSLYSQDIVNGIVLRYADPSFHVDVSYELHPEIKLKFPIINVPGNHKVPIRTKHGGPNNRHLQANKYYIRRPGPQSETPQSSQEWDNLIGKCVRAHKEELIEQIRNLLSPPVLSISTNEIQIKDQISAWTDSSINRWSSKISSLPPDEKPHRYSHGIWHVSYSILGDFDEPNIREFLDILKKVEGRETGWPVWLVHQPKPFNESIECWIRSDRFPDGAHSDYWRASPDGYLFLLRGYQEDSQGNGDHTPGTVFDFILPIWRMGECLLHAERLAKSLDANSGSVFFKVTWKGLMDRRLVSWVQPRQFFFRGGTSNQYSVTSELLIPIENISILLPEIIQELTDPLYMAFDFFELSLEIIKKEIVKLRSRAR